MVGILLLIAVGVVILGYCGFLDAMNEPIEENDRRARQFLANLMKMVRASQMTPQGAQRAMERNFPRWTREQKERLRDLEMN